MKSLNKVRTIFFDYDGTLHDSIHIYAPAFQKAYDYLVCNGYADKRKWSDKEISHWLGYNPTDMWRVFQPNLSDNIRQVCSEIIGEEMKHQILCGKPSLYEGSLDTLKYLQKKDYQLVFISNCKTYYMEYHRDLFQLNDYFEAMCCSEQFAYKPKYEILKSIKNDYKEQMVIVGDRIQDIEAGKKNNLITIGCRYGFGVPEELKDADYLIDDIRELGKLL